jgi:hypothetical protein
MYLLKNDPVTLTGLRKKTEDGTEGTITPRVDDIEASASGVLPTGSSAKLA